MSEELLPLTWLEGEAFPLFLAPMAGVTDPIFRTICKELGADVMLTEFVSAEGLLQAWERNRRYIEFEEAHRPLGVQLFGSNPERMGMAAKLICEHQKPDFIDLNCGCPVPKVVGKNGGSSLLKDLPLLESIARAMVSAVGDQVPVTAKIRLGWDAQSICAVECCQRLESAGVRMVTIHGRTRSQQYGGEADWEAIHACTEACSLPIIGNGDITAAEDVQRIQENYGVAGVMIGRAAMGNPWLFAQIKHQLATGEKLSPPTREEHVDLMCRHALMAVESGRYGAELYALRALRSHLIAYAKQIPGNKVLRPRLARVSSLQELHEILH